MNPNSTFYILKCFVNGLRLNGDMSVLTTQCIKTHLYSVDVIVKCPSSFHLWSSLKVMYPGPGLLTGELLSWTELCITLILICCSQNDWTGLREISKQLVTPNTQPITTVTATATASSIQCSGNELTRLKVFSMFLSAVPVLWQCDWCDLLV